MAAQSVHGQPTMLRVYLKDIPPDGLSMDCEVNPEWLELPSEEGKVEGGFHWEGVMLKTHDGASVSGTLSGVLIRECVRCLQEFTDPVSIPCNGVFLATQSEAGQISRADQQSTTGDIGQDLLEEKYPCVENQVELGKMLREQVILATPLQPLCRSTCLGLCQTCGHNLNQGPCQCVDRDSHAQRGTIRLRVGKARKS